MSWLNVAFPPRLSFGIQCDPEWDTNIVTTIAGFESRNLKWIDARHTYDASFVIRTMTDHKEIRAHFHMARGRTHSWPLLDPSDHECAKAEGVVSWGAETDTFQLMKRYGSGDLAYDRKITRPFAVALYDGVDLMVEGVDYTIDLDTGIVTGGDIDMTWSGSFYVPCRYDTPKLPIRIDTRQGGSGEFLLTSDSIPIVEVRE